MTKEVMREIKRQAQRGMRENGLRVYQKDMSLLECGYSEKNVYGISMVAVNYVMFEDAKTGKQWQCYYGAKYYNSELNTLWYVEEYIA